MEIIKKNYRMDAKKSFPDFFTLEKITLGFTVKKNFFLSDIRTREVEISLKDFSGSAVCG